MLAMRKVIQGAGRSLSSMAVKDLKLGSAAAAGSVAGSDVLIKMIASPINAMDVSTSKSGSEGVGMVAAMGDKVTGLREGDWVLPPLGTGAWASEIVMESSKLMRVPNDIPASYAATMSGDLATAYRLLHDFAKLEAGDFIVQSDAYSAVGMAVIQMAKQMGVKTVNVVDNGVPDLDNKLRLLTSLGGDVNVTSDFFASHEYSEVMKGAAVKLALMGDSAESAADMARTARGGGTMVSYSAAGAAKVPKAITAFIESEMKVKTAQFSIADWYKTCKTMDRAQMNANIASMVRSQHLTMFYEEHDFDDFAHALETATNSHGMRKVVLRMDAPDRMAEHDARDPKEYEVFQTDTV